MKNNTATPWLEAGYEIFALEGPGGLKVETIAKKVGISKSSFYHLFVDLEIFQEELLKYHITQAEKMAALSQHCQNIDPDTLHLFIEYKIPLLFNRQLCINRENKLYQFYFEKATSLVETTYFDKWVDLLGLHEQKHIARNILKIYTDNFFMRISKENLNYNWLQSLLEEIKTLVKDVKKPS